MPRSGQFQLDFGFEHEHVTSFLCNSSLATFYLTSCLRLCLENSDGGDTLFMAHDEFLNFHLAGMFPRDKIWRSEYSSFPAPNFLTENPFLDIEWEYKEYLWKAYEALKLMGRNNLTAKYLDHVNKTGSAVGQGLSEYVYVPRSYNRMIIHAIDELDKVDPNIFQEAAIPLILNLVAPGDENMALLPEFIAWGEERDMEDLLRQRTQENIHYHPLKPGNPLHREIWRERMAKIYAQMVK
jgi:hypothetical protein